MYDLPRREDEKDWFDRHKGLTFLVAAALTFVVPLVFTVGLSVLLLPLKWLADLF